MKIAAIVQARTGSSRLPGKVLKELPPGCGVTVLEHVVTRLRHSSLLNDVIIATTTESDDDRLVSEIQKAQVLYFRGSQNDVLSRYYFAAKENDVDVIVRITSDCPCLDPKIIDDAIQMHLDTDADYTSNTLKRTYPHGMDVEVFNFEVLKEAHERATEPYEREHVCPYIYKSNPGAFKISHLIAPDGICEPDIRITLDTQEDYDLLCAVFDCLYSPDNLFCLTDIIELFDNKPWLRAINKNVVQKIIVETFDQEFDESVRVLKLRGYDRVSELLMKNRKSFCDLYINNTSVQADE